MLRLNSWQANILGIFKFFGKDLVVQIAIYNTLKEIFFAGQPLKHKIWKI